MLLSVPCSALEFIKCNAIEGKTLYATFGRIVTSGGAAPIYYPIEFVVFSGPKILQERIIYPSTKASLAIPMAASPSAVEFSFTSILPDGHPQDERFELHRFSPKSLTGFVGTWDTFGPALQASVRVMCSVY